MNCFQDSGSDGQGYRRFSEKADGGSFWRNWGCTIIVMIAWAAVVVAGCWMKMKYTPRVVLLGIMLALSGCSAPAKTETSAPSASASLTEERTTYDPNGKPFETIRTIKSGTATGSGAHASGDDVDQKMESQPANVNVNGGVHASGGGGKSDSEVEGQQSLWSNPMLWTGIACILAAGFCVYKTQIRAALCLLAAGGFLIGAAIYPALAIYACAGAVAIIAGPYIWAEIKRHRSTEALRAVAAGVANAPPEAQGPVLVEIGKQADEADKRLIKQIKRKDDL